MHPVKTFCFKQADGLDLCIDAHIPRDPNGAAVLYYHGGAAIVGSRAYRSWKSRSTRGKSLLFLLLIEFGYIMA